MIVEKGSPGWRRWTGNAYPVLRDSRLGYVDTELQQLTVDSRRPRRERARLQFGAEVFNLSNHSNPLRVSPYYASRDRQLDSYGQALETLNARQIQWLVQLEY